MMEGRRIIVGVYAIIKADKPKKKKKLAGGK